ncbi:MAG: mechanosensitive ion channel [Armatimonadetes bacterium]|nr:mechanosensitive ion channel [Armatimonadota bacterium]
MEWFDKLLDFVPDPLLQTALKVAIVVAATWALAAAVGGVVEGLGRLIQSRVDDPVNKRRTAAFFVVGGSLLKGAIVFLAALMILRESGLSGEVTAKVVGTLAVAWVVYVVLSRAIRAAALTAESRIDSEPHRQRVKTLILLGESVARYTIIIAAGLTALAQLGLNLAPVLAGAGIAGLAVGFGAQNFVRDVISGFFIILEGQYAVGDLATINGIFGRVERVGLRTTALREADGQLRFFPNGSIASAENFTEDYVSYVVTIPVPREEPQDPIPAIKAILDDFETEFRVFATEPKLQVADLPSYARVVRARMRLVPGRHTFMEQKLAARMTAGLTRAGHPLPEGTEVGMSLRYPPPGAKA